MSEVHCEECEKFVNDNRARHQLERQNFMMVEIGKVIRDVEWDMGSQETRFIFGKLYQCTQCKAVKIV